MAKLKRAVVGSIVKGQDGKPDYLKVFGNHTLKDKQILQLSSQTKQLEDLDKAVEAGKLSGDLEKKIRERIEKIPSFVRFEVIALTENTEE